MIDDHLTSDRFRQICSEIGFDLGEGHVDAGRDPCRGPDLPIMDIDAVGIHRHAREPRLQQGRPAPVRRRAVAIQYASLGQVEGARTDARHTPCGRCKRSQ